MGKMTEPQGFRAKQAVQTPMRSREVPTLASQQERAGATAWESGMLANEVRADRVAISMYPSISPVMNACRYCRPNGCPSVRSLQCVWTYRLGRHHRQIDSDRELHLDVAAPAEQRPRGTAPPYARQFVCLFV